MCLVSVCGLDLVCPGQNKNHFQLFPWPTEGTGDDCGWLCPGLALPFPARLTPHGSSPAPDFVPESPVPPPSGRVLRDAVGALTPTQGRVDQVGTQCRAG